MHFTVLFVKPTLKFFVIEPYSAQEHLPRAHKFLCSIEQDQECVIAVSELHSLLSGHKNLATALRMLADNATEKGLKNYSNLLSDRFTAAGTIQQKRIDADGWESHTSGSRHHQLTSRAHRTKQKSVPLEKRTHAPVSHGALF